MAALVIAAHLPLAGWASGAESEVLAEVNGETITSDEVEQAIGAPLRNLEEHIYRMKRQKLEELIGQRLLDRESAKRGISVETLVDAEVASKW
jgi:SurA-like N-terminal domain